MHKLARWAGVISLAGFLVLAILVHFFPILRPDIMISQELQEEGGKNILPVMAAISFFGTPLVASLSIILTSAVFLALSYKREAVLILATFIADGIDALIKLIINRPRPGPNFVQVIQHLTDPSFPSGHVVHYVVFFGSLYVVIHSIWKPGKAMAACFSGVFIALVGSISLSRVYLGTHWPTDVLGGYMLGFIMLWLMLHTYFRGHSNQT